MYNEYKIKHFIFKFITYTYLIEDHNVLLKHVYMNPGVKVYLYYTNIIRGNWYFNRLHG